jgi:hypothetical protein
MPRSNPAGEWSRLMFGASRLWAEAGMVVALRSWRLMAGGPAAERELERMVGEKTEAGFELAGALAGGRVKSPEAAARKALGVYGKRVRANRKRLG